MDDAWLEELPPLVKAAARGDSITVATLLHAGSDPNEADEEGGSALHAAATRDHPDVVERLLSAGANVDELTQDGVTPLLNAASAGRRVISRLLEAGADPDVREPRLGWRPLDRFADYGNADGIELVLAAGAPVAESDALGSAAEAGSDRCVDLLLAAGADPTQTFDGKNPAELAAKHGYQQLAQRLSDASSATYARREGHA